jgi:squalene-hopene/tetraprenyl-beta-curcumene cyclase
LAEVTTVRPASSAELRELQRLGEVAIDRLVPAPGAGRALFSTLFAATYQSDCEPVRPNARFGLALEFARDATPSVKAYFDLYATGRQHASTKLRDTLAALGMEQSASHVERLAGSNSPADLCRGIGVEFNGHGFAGARLYLAGKYLSWAGIERLLVALDQAERVPSLRPFRRLVLNGIDNRTPLNSMLIGLVFSPRLPPGAALVKLDAHLPSLKVDDAASADATNQLCAAEGIDWSPIRDAGQHLDRHSANARVRQYLSLDVLPNGQHKISAYFRPAMLDRVPAAARPSSRLPDGDAVETNAVERAIRVLESARNRGFDEAAHRMSFPRAAGFTGQADERIGLVFQRALIAEALLDAALAGFTVDWSGIDEDAAWLVDQRTPGMPGGWRYFPTLAELPPDADDLAVILRVLARAGRSDVGELCDPSIELIASRLMSPAGGFPTWIIDPRDRGEVANLMRTAVAVHWGTGVDVEVVANLAYSVLAYHLVAADRFTAAAGYVASRQEPSGGWRSSWYHSPLWATWACVRLLAHQNPRHPALAHAAAFLTQSQAADGGWGPVENRVVDTALGLSAVSSLAAGRPGLKPIVDRASASLARLQHADGTWPAGRLIAMDTNRVATLAGRGEPRIVSYGSRTVTTALCLQALSLTRRWGA